MKYHRLSRYKIKRIIFCFSEDITANSASKILHINRNMINVYYNEIREKILQHSLKEKELGEFELAKVTLERGGFVWRSRGNTGVWAAGKVFVTVVPNCSKEELIPIIQGKSWPNGWKVYDGLILNGYNHYRVFHHENDFARGKSHVNGIECFWSYAKHHKFINGSINILLINPKVTKMIDKLREDSFKFF